MLCARKRHVLAVVFEATPLLYRWQVLQLHRLLPQKQAVLGKV